jgi:RNA-directed DNA polymerase
MMPDDETATVPTTAERVDSTADRWSWVERAVWTERMLQALETGVKGGSWYVLMDKVCAPKNLAAAFARVAKSRGSAGIDHITIGQYRADLAGNLAFLSKELSGHSYRSHRLRRVEIPKPGSAEKRSLSIPTVRDRVVQAAVKQVLEPIFERDFAEHSYGFRPGRGCKDALREVETQLRDGNLWVVDADIRRFFDSIPHELLLEQMRKKVVDGGVLSLIEQFLKAGVLEGLSEWTPRGTPQGAVISPLLANIYLDPLDHLMARAGQTMVRYADDFVILCRTRTEAEEALSRVRTWMNEAGLELHQDKTRVVSMANGGGFDFLGYHFELSKKTPGKLNKWPREKSRQALRDAIREKTRRTNGHSLGRIIESLNRTLVGWFEYFKHSHGWTFKAADGFVRRRLRSILSRRAGLDTRSPGFNHLRWTNAYFENAGLFSMVTRHRAIVAALKG